MGLINYNGQLPDVRLFEVVLEICIALDKSIKPQNMKVILIIS